MKDYAKHDFLKDIEVEGNGGFKGDWIVLAMLIGILVVVFVG